LWPQWFPGVRGQPAGYRVADLVHDNVDIALRVGPLGNSPFVAHKITKLTQIVCLSLAYLAKYGRPVHPSDLAQHLLSNA